MGADLTLLPLRGAPPARLTDALTSAAGYALSEKADATRRAYRADIRRFSTWCEAVGAIALPATPATVAAYLAALADLRLKVSTISRRAAAIAYAHKLASFEPPINESVKAVMRGIRRKLGTAQKGKAPATAAVVAKLVKRIPDDLSGKRDKALILIGFAAALRRSELVALTIADIERATDGIVLYVRRSKTDQDGQGDQIAVPNGRKLKPVEALDAWLEAGAITQGPIFRRVRKGEGHRGQLELVLTVLFPSIVSTPTKCGRDSRRFLRRRGRRMWPLGARCSVRGRADAASGSFESTARRQNRGPGPRRFDLARVCEVAIVVAVLGLEQLVRIDARLEPRLGRGELALRRADWVRIRPARSAPRCFRNVDRRIDAAGAQARHERQELLLVAARIGPEGEIGLTLKPKHVSDPIVEREAGYERNHGGVEFAALRPLRGAGPADRYGGEDHLVEGAGVDEVVPEQSPEFPGKAVRA